MCINWFRSASTNNRSYFKIKSKSTESCFCSSDHLVVVTGGGAITLQNRCTSKVVIGQLLVAVLPFPSLCLAWYINSNNYRGHPVPGRFLLKLNSLTRYRYDERSMTKTN